MTQKQPATAPKTQSPNGWRIRNRQWLQSLALSLALVSPFFLYWALNQGWVLPAALCFFLFTLSMLLTAWIG